MSMYSGKCDLYDHMSGLSGWYDRNGNKIKFGEGTGPYYSDEYNDFLEFKKRTQGTLYQHHKVLVSEWNQEEVKKHCKNFDYIHNTRIVNDARCKNGKREESYYEYYYYGKKFSSLKELNKHGVYIVIEIHFNTLLDLIPYYPYIISACACSEGKETVFISQLPYPIEERNDSLKRGGCVFDNCNWYHKKLQEHYRNVVLTYYNLEGREIEENLLFHNLNGKYIGYTLYPIDDQFEVKWKYVEGYWTSPKIIGERELEMSKEDAEGYLKKYKYLTVCYVRKKEHKLNLG